MQARTSNVVLLLPCAPVTPSTTVPAAHGLLHSFTHALPHVHRHALHAVRHATRAAIRHPKVIAGAGCRAAPLLLASNILAVPLPIYAPPEAAVQPVATTQPAPNP